MYYVSKRMEIAGAHQLNLSYDSPCSRLHGHNWVIIVYCKSPELNNNGMVVDFAKIKKHVINPVESREASLELPKTLAMQYDIPSEVATLDKNPKLEGRHMAMFLSPKTNK